MPRSPRPASTDLHDAPDDMLRLLVRSVEDYAIFMLDPDGMVASWNAGAERAKGYRASEILGKHFSVFYPPEAIDRRWPWTEIERARELGRFEDEGWRVRKDGSRFWANVVITALIDERGELRGYAKVTRDLSERRKQEEALRQSEERFRLLVESVRDYAILRLDPQGIIASWNAGAAQMKGYRAEEIIGKHFSVFYPPDVIANGWPALELENARKLGRFEDEGWRVRKDGSRFWANVVITALRDATGVLRGFSKITRDLTDRLMVEKLETNARNMHEFIAMLAHELRNPLAPIRNAGGIMARFALDPERVAWAAGVIERQTAQLTRLVDDLLDVSRITAGKMRLDRAPVDITDVVTRAVESVRHYIESRQHKLTLEVATPTRVWGDLARLTQVVGNLLHNAAKFTPPHGEIALAVRNEGGVATISVRDNGEGMAPELLARAFELFSQGSVDFARSRSGLGLGLTIVKRLVELHGGSVAAHSAGKGQGSEFVVTVPLLVDLAGSESQPGNLRSPTRDGLHVMVVDDNSDSVDTLRMLIELAGDTVSIASDGASALATAEASPPDVLLLDLVLPDVSGFDIAKRIRAQAWGRSVLLIATTGFGQDDDRRRTRAAGFDHHLVKPVDFETLERHLADFRAKRRRNSESTRESDQG